jgi:glutamate carboxypeptidase
MPLDHSIQEYFQNKFPSYLTALQRMVEINSFTTNPSGVNALGEMTANLFDSLGFQREFVQSAKEEYGQHVLLTRIGQNVKEDSSGRTIALISHLDTVFPEEEEIANNFHWNPQGDRIYGPGTVDIKGGTLMIYMVLDALQNFAQEAFEAVTWKIFLDAAEEALSDDFGDLCLDRLGEGTIACLVFEGGTLNGDSYPLVTARKGRATYRVQVEGRSAHAGNNHPQGANAIVQLAHTVQKIAALTDYDRHLTFNVGTIWGGTVVNRVPHLAEASVEMRTFSPQVFEEGVEDMLALNGVNDVASSDGYPCKVHIELQERTEPWPSNVDTEGLFSIWEEAAASFGLKIKQEERGGLSDGNHLWEHFPTLDGLGPSGGNAHCSERSLDGSKDQEYVLVPSFIPKALINTAAILELIGENK